MKKLPKAQLGAIVKGAIKYGSKGIKSGAKIGARAGKINKVSKSVAKVISKPKKPLLTGDTDVTIPAMIGTYGGAALLSAWMAGAFDKKKTIKKKKIIKKKP